MAAQRTLDVLIITALRSEYEAVLEVNAGALDGSAWATRSGPLGHEIAFRVFSSEPAGGHLEVAVTWATDMGGVATASEAEQLIAAYSPRCLAMCGVCAGRRGDVNVGDVIVADWLYMYDAGKDKVEYPPDGTRSDQFLSDGGGYKLRSDWRKRAESFGVPEELRALVATRPRSYEVQADWILERLFKKEDPREHPELEQKAPNFSDVIELLWKKKLVEDATFSLTEAGQKRINRLLLKHLRGLPEPEDFRVRVGPIGSGNKVVQDPKIFDVLAERNRKVLGLEMEAMAIGAVAWNHLEAIRYMIVMKGVMDHADDWKSDGVKEFAARASAACLIAFLRRNLPPVDRFGDILDTGISAKPATPAPSALLQARHRYISFYEPGRAAILGRLRAFSEAPAPVGVWLIYGAGGMGKTRLMIEACERYRAEGWIAGFLLRGSSRDRFEALLASDLPALLVLDYAESWPELSMLLATLAQERVRKRAAPVRVVLLSRNAGDWWTALTERDGPTTALLSEREPEAIEPIVHEKAKRVEIVRVAASEFAGVVGRSIPRKEIPPLDDERFERVLYLHMAALAWVSGIEFTAETLMDATLAHEERFWVTQAGALQDSVGEQVFVEKTRRAVAAMTLCGGLASKAAGYALLRRLDESVDERLLLFLRRLYPGRLATAAECATYASALEPDLLGEQMVRRTIRIFEKHGDSAQAYLKSVFAGETEGALRAGFLLLGRLSVRHAEEVRPWIASVLAEDLEGRAVAALEAAKTLGERTALASVGMEMAGALKREGTLELAERLEKAGVPDFTVSLREVRAWVTEMRMQLFPQEAETEDARAARARQLNNLGVDQGELGQREAALGSTAEAVALCRALAKARPDAFLPDLAMSLNNLGNRQSDLGQRKAALGSTAEAIDICRTLVKARPDVFLRDLAAGLNNLGLRQSDLGQREAALGSISEAVEKYRALVKARPDVFLPDLAMSLNNLGAMQGALGQWEAALGSTAEAVEIRRALVKARPDVFLPDLARSLINLAIHLLRLERATEVLPLAQESLDLLWPVYERYPKAYEARIHTMFQVLEDVYKTLNIEPDATFAERLKRYQALAGT